MRRGSRLGVEIAELALALPVMVTIVFGTLELCELMFLKQSLSVASYEAGRLAARPGVTSQVVRDRFTQIMAARRVRSSRITITPADLTLANRGDTIRIDVAAPVAGNSSTNLVLRTVPDVTESAFMVRE
jgi:Flp pilus assembly protein TadG